MIRLFLSWLEVVGVDSSRWRFRISIHESADLESAELYWRHVVNRDGAAFARATLKRHNPKTVRKQVGDGYRGCLVVSVLPGSELYKKIDGWWRGIVVAADRQNAAQCRQEAPATGAALG